MDFIIKYFLLLMLGLPFAALLLDALGKTKNLVIFAAVAVTVLSALILLTIGGLHQRPRVAGVYSLAFLLWPIALLLAKYFNPYLSWGLIWGTVPVMSWYLVNTSMQFYYPTDAGGGGLGFGVGLILGWTYMLIPFGLLSALYVGISHLSKGRSRR